MFYLLDFYSCCLSVILCTILQHFYLIHVATIDALYHTTAFCTLLQYVSLLVYFVYVQIRNTAILMLLNIVCSFSLSFEPSCSQKLKYSTVKL